jgi:DNA replication and repair protein RecF
VKVLTVRLRDFRGYADAQAGLGDGLTVVSGPNGAGKTNLLEAIYFGCTGRSCRTANEREIVRFGTSTVRVTASAEGPSGRHELTVGFSPGDGKRMTFDGAPVERLLDVADRPLVSVFLPERLELIKGPPALRRAHLDQFIAAMWPSRTATRRAYNQALAQRNALLHRIRSGRGSRDSLASWNAQLAGHGVALIADRSRAVEALAGGFCELGARLGMEGGLRLSYRPRTAATEAGQLAAELSARVELDLERGFTGHGPHRDELLISREGRDLRAFGSQGQQRLAVLTLLLAEREAIARTREGAPLMLLDDVMSELDGQRRAALIELLRAGGQSVITTTDLEHVPGAGAPDVTRLAVSDGRILQEALAA